MQPIYYSTKKGAYLAFLKRTSRLRGKALKKGCFRFLSKRDAKIKNVPYHFLRLVDSVNCSKAFENALKEGQIMPHRGSTDARIISAQVEKCRKTIKQLYIHSRSARRVGRRVSRAFSFMTTSSGSDPGGDSGGGDGQSDPDCNRVALAFLDGGNFCVLAARLGGLALIRHTNLTVTSKRTLPASIGARGGGRVFCAFFPVGVAA